MVAWVQGLREQSWREGPMMNLWKGQLMAVEDPEDARHLGVVVVLGVGSEGLVPHSQEV